MAPAPPSKVSSLTYLLLHGAAERPVAIARPAEECGHRVIEGVPAQVPDVGEQV